MPRKRIKDLVEETFLAQILLPALCVLRPKNLASPLLMSKCVFFWDMQRSNLVSEWAEQITLCVIPIIGELYKLPNHLCKITLVTGLEQLLIKIPIQSKEILLDGM